MFSKGILTLLLCSFLGFIASFVLNNLTPFKTGHYLLSLGLFVLLFFILNIIYNNKGDIKTFSQILLGTISVKLLIFLVAIFLYGLWNKPGLPVFFVHFSAHYILFTVFEIRYLLLIIKNRSTHTL